MNQSRSNPAAESALPKMQLAGDPRAGLSGANIKENRGGSTSVSYPDGSNYTTKDSTTYYNQANGDRAKSMQFSNGNRQNDMYTKGGRTGEFDTPTMHETKQFNRADKLQQTDTTDKTTGQTRDEQAPLPKDFKEKGYDPSKIRGWEKKTNNRATL
jgi:hypothetical protein